MAIKILSALSLVVMIVCSTLRYLLFYHLGYAEESYSAIEKLDDASLMGAVFFSVLVVTWIVSLIVRRHSIWTGWCMIGLVALMVVVRVAPAPTELVYGLRARVLHDGCLNDLRRFAKDFDGLVGGSVGVPGRAYSYMRDDLDKTDLKAKYPFLSWVRESNFDGPSVVYEADRVVEVRWGAAYEGHWGFAIRVDGGKLDPASEPGGIRVSDDVLVMSELH